MKFQLEIADRLRTIEVARTATGFEVIVDGQPRLVEAVPVGNDVWSLIVRDEPGSTPRSVEAAVVPGPAGNGQLEVHIDGYRIPVNLRNGRGRRSRVAVTRGDGPHRVVAPMPGKVVRVLVSVGDEVKARQGLVVVEAMKMENELRAARDGRVSDVLVHEGQSVEAGATLLVVT